MNKLDMEPVMALLKEAYAIAQKLDQQVWDDNTKGSPEKAELSRTISYLSDKLAMGAAVVRNEYWIGKGFKDSITTPVTDEGEA
jgi:hypothetical protein